LWCSWRITRDLPDGRTQAGDHHLKFYDRRDNLDAAYERRSVAVTSNIHPSGFDQIMPKTLATATVDRLLHHAHLVVTKATATDSPRPWPARGWCH
jgi:IstB-like ATP binding protein